MSADALRETLAAVRADGRQRNIRCPAHEDRRASLSVGGGAENRILLKCQAGCATADVVTAAGLTLADLGPSRRPTSTRRIVETYDYVDEQRQLLFQVVRFSPKDFRQRRPNGHGEWTWNMKGVRRVLFGLPDLAGPEAYLPEGERDVRTLRDLHLVATTNPGGAGKWRDDYTQQLTGAGVQLVVILPDNDPPGRDHAETVARACHAAGLAVKVVNLPDLPDKGDVSDWLQAGHTREDLIARVTSTPVSNQLGRKPPTSKAPASTPCTLADVEHRFAQWLCDDDRVPTRAALATYVANRHLTGDPVWLMLVGGSGIGKTERITPLAVMADVVLASSITGPAALLSGTARKERAADATGGLLRRFPEGGGLLLLKDFTSIIDMHRDARAEILAALREVHDGRWDRSIGAEGGKTLTWIGHLGIIAGVTTAVDSAHMVMQAMGTRFVQVRVFGDDQKLAEAVLAHAGQERAMREDLRAAVRGLLDHLPGTPYAIDDVRQALAALGSYTARARSPVDRDHRSEIRLVLDPEAPTRIVAMLAQLWRACGLLGLAKPDAWAMVRRVGMDSIPKLRRAILDYLADCLHAPTTTDVGDAVDHPTQTTRRALEDLAAHRVITCRPGGDGKPHRWELATRTREWLDQTVPVLSDHIAPSPSQIPTDYKTTTPDKTGKVFSNKTGPDCELNHGRF